MINKFTRIISMILVIAFLVTVLPSETFAIDETRNNLQAVEEMSPTDLTLADLAKENSNEEEYDISSITAEQLVGELIEERTEDTKHFRLADGSQIAVQYEEPIHYKTEAGTWQDIDNRFELKDSLGKVVKEELVASDNVLDVLSEKYKESAKVSDFTEPEVAQEGRVTESTGLIDEVLVTAREAEGQHVDSRQTEEKQSETINEQAKIENEIAESATPEAANERVVAAEKREFTISDETFSKEVYEEITSSKLDVKENAFDASFAVSSGIGEEISTSYDKYSVGFSLIGANKKAANIVENSVPEDASILSALVLPNVSSTVEYKEVLGNVDLQYMITGNEIKETILVNSTAQEYVYSFALNLKNLTPIPNEDGSVSIIDSITKEEIYLIPAPFMFDANNVYSSDVEYKLEEKSGKYILTVVASAEWINDSARTFPVSIDPSLWLTRTGQPSFDLSYICAGYPDDAHPWTTMYVGYDSYLTWENRTLMKPTLPTLPSNSVIVNASFYLCQIGYSNISTSMENMHIEAHQLTSSSNILRATWNNPPSHSSEIIDYKTVSSSTRGTYTGWDITRLVKKWYSGTAPNYGIMLKATDGSTMNSSRAAKADFYSYGNIPKFVIHYRNNVGLEEYYTYQAQDVGRAGTAYVSDYNAQLTLVKNDFTNTGAATFSLEHVYNSTISSMDFTANTGNINTADYSQMLMGYGWKLSAQQTIVERTFKDQDDANKTYLVYNDADGTEHYFSPTSSGSTTYEDEDGLNLKIQKISSTQHKLTDDVGNYIEFYNGKMGLFCDTNGNKIYFVYNNASASLTGTAWQPTSAGSSRLLCIKQLNNGESTPLTLATLVYNNNGYLSSITDQAGCVTSYLYSSGRLTTVTHYDGTTVTYTYDANNKMLSAADNELRYKISYTYSPSTGKVASIKEYGNGSLGNSINVNTTVDGFTEYRVIGKDRSFNTTDDILSYYLFDYVGRTINSYSTTNAGDIIGAENAVYTKNTGTTKTNNRMTTAAVVGVSAVNIIKNGGMESDSYWSKSGTSGTASLSYTQPRTGQRSMSVSKTSGQTGTITYTQTTETLPAGTYTFSVYVNTTGVTNFTGSGISIGATHSNTHYPYTSYKVINSTSVNDGWTKISATFKSTTSGAFNLSISFTGYTGVIYVDDAQLELSSGSSRENLLENAGFENTSNWPVSANTFYSSGDKRSGARSLQMNGAPGRITSTDQEVKINLSGKQTYVLSGWARASSIPTNGEGWGFALLALIKYSDGTTETHDVQFCSDTTEWQYTSKAIVPKQPTKTVASIIVYCRYDNNGNTAYFDNVSLVREAAQTYKYNTNGDLVSVTSTGETDETYSYQGANLMRTLTGAVGTYTFTYDNNKNLKTVQNEKVTLTMAYDNKGNATGTVLSGTGGDGRTLNSYSEYYGYSGNLKTSETENNGVVTNYMYGSGMHVATGTPSSIRDARNNTTNYDINPYNGRLTLAYISGKISLDYGYAYGELSSLIRGGYAPNSSTKVSQTYMFNRNIFGDITSAQVSASGGTQTLATYQYFGQNGPVSRFTYGNNQYEEYTYDNLERLSKLSYNNSTGYNYTYTGEGDQYEVISLDSTEKNTYSYDSIDRIALNNFSNSSTRLTQTVRYSYTPKSQPYGVGVIAESINTGRNINVYETYNYNTNGTISQKYMFTGIHANLTYDHLMRLTQRTTQGTSFTTNYAYVNKTSTTTTPLISALTYKNGSTTLRSFTYQYDAIGQVTSVAGEASYTYDAQNQIATETNTTANSNFTYAYDTYGNIRSISRTGSGGGTTTLTYGNTKWLDQLTAVNGSSITYDGAGNPTKYYTGANMTWQRGRQLAAYVSGGTTTAYTYNSDGLRIRKSVGGTIHDYVLEDSRIVADLTSGSSLIFAYDETGRAHSFTYNGTLYYYITNLQGDVIEIRNTSGAQVATYVYNAYGQLLSSSGTMANINPLRYRGYYFDTESGFYYLNSRYYDPAICRFVSADTTELILTHLDDSLFATNLYTYCLNSPVNYYDPDGEFAITATVFISAAMIAAIMEAVVYTVLLVLMVVLLVEAAEHVKNKRPSTWQKHTEPRPGRLSEKKRQDPKWEDRSNKKKGNQQKDSPKAKKDSSNKTKASK